MLVRLFALLCLGITARLQATVVTVTLDIAVTNVHDYVAGTDTSQMFAAIATATFDTGIVPQPPPPFPPPVGLECTAALRSRAVFTSCEQQATRRKCRRLEEERLHRRLTLVVMGGVKALGKHLLPAEQKKLFLTRL